MINLRFWKKRERNATVASGDGLPVDFDPALYLLANPDVAESGADPATHWLTHGRHEGRAYRIDEPSRADLDRLKSSKIFDPTFYRNHYPDIAESDADPYIHYLQSGAKEGRWASYLFRTDWYMDRYPEAREADNALFHYMDIGSLAGYNPNPFFDPDYYRLTYLEDLNGMEPLEHFAIHGHKGFNPSPRFHTLEYISQIGINDVNPLAHYLAQGMEEGITPERSQEIPPDEVVESARIQCLKSGQLSAANALLITHSPNGRIKSHVERLASALSRSGYGVILIVAADKNVAYLPDSLDEHCSYVYVRQNIGFDFAAWAHVLKLNPNLFDCDELLLLNDSILGPVKTDHLDDLTGKIRNSPADVVGLTSNFEYAHHVQSYYISFKKNALTSEALRNFFKRVINYPEKNLVIREYEITLAARLKRGGLLVDTLFPAYYKGVNPTIWQWERLLEDGFPFVKMAMLTGEQAGTHFDPVTARLHKEKFPSALIPEPYRRPTLVKKNNFGHFFSRWPKP